MSRYKLTNKDGINRGQQLHNGENVPDYFDKKSRDDACSRGLYYTDRAGLFFWSWSFGYEYVYDVVVPENAKVIENGAGCQWKARANRLCLSNKRHIDDVIAEFTNVELLEFIGSNHSAIRMIKPQKWEDTTFVHAFLDAGYPFFYVPNKTREYCEYAARINPNNIHYLDDGSRTPKSVN